MTTTDLTKERVARNQATFREANEKIEATADKMQLPPERPVPFICECAERACMELVRLTVEEYEDVRQHARRFFVVPGHAAPATAIGAAVVVAELPGYTLVDKIGVAGEVAEQLYDEQCDEL